MIFIDSSVFIAYANQRDRFHIRSEALIRDAVQGEYGQAVTSDYVFDEVVTTTLVRTRDFAIARSVGEYLLSSEVDLRRVEERDFETAWGFFEKYRNLSFTDCTCLALMKARTIRRIASFDGGFLGKAEVVGLESE